MKAANIGVLAVLGVIFACGGGRPEGELQTGEVAITASATADGIPLGSAGITAAAEIVVTGNFTDRFGVETSSYSWNDGPLLPLALGPNGDFELTLTLVNDENILRLEGTSIVGDTITSLDLPYVKDGVAPTIVPPDATFAARIVNESDMTMNMESTSFTLSGGTPAPVQDGVAFSKYSSTYGPTQANLPVWRFNLEDNHDLSDAFMEFRVFDDDNGEELVGWTDASPSEEAMFEFTISSALNERFGEVSGDFRIEVRAFDSAGNPSDAAVQHWSQTVLAPPIHARAGEESIIVEEERLDPQGFVLGLNFANRSEQVGIVVGSMVLGNPNDVPVLVKVPVSMTALASYGMIDISATILYDVDHPPGYPCGTARTIFQSDECVGSVSGWHQPWVYRRMVDPTNSILFKAYDVAGNPVEAVESDANVFLVPPNTELRLMATLRQPMGNLHAGIHDYASIGPAFEHATARKKFLYLECVVEGPQGTCATWNLSEHFRYQYSAYASWDFEVELSSKVNLDLTSDTEWQMANPDIITGYSRVMSAGDTYMIGAAPAPTSHDDDFLP